MKKKIMLVFGTRPDAVKMCPLAAEMKKRDAFETLVCVTGQHREMLASVLDTFGIVPDYDLAVMQPRQTLFDITTRVLTGMRDVLEQASPDLVLVHGDTSTAFASALAAFYLKILVGHVEAGLRTEDISSPFPEEMNRRGVGILADLHFAPTQTSRSNLLAEGKDDATIFVTGNTVIDALATTVREDYRLPEQVHPQRRLIFMTAHRRENLGEPMVRICHAVRRIVRQFEDVEILWPVHPNPAVREPVFDILGDCPRVILTDPVDVLDCHNLMARAYMIMTDSGGLQEEAPALGKPVLVLRDSTERPEGVEAGTLWPVGTDEDAIVQAATSLLTDSQVYTRMARAKNPYGDGTASRQIADILERWSR